MSYYFVITVTSIIISKPLSKVRPRITNSNDEFIFYQSPKTNRVYFITLSLFLPFFVLHRLIIPVLLFIIFLMFSSFHESNKANWETLLKKIWEKSWVFLKFYYKKNNKLKLKTATFYNASFYLVVLKSLLKVDKFVSPEIQETCDWKFQLYYC